MDVDVSPLDAKVERLERRITDLEQRLERLEVRQPAADAPAGIVAAGGHAPQHAPDEVHVPTPDVGTIVTLIGRTLFVLAGAFLLRTFTESGRIDAGTGVVLGLAFALTWVVMADRSGGRGQRVSAAFHGLAFVLIALPLLFEATNRFRFLEAGSAAIVLGGGVAIALLVSWHRRLRAVAWIATVGGMVTAIALAFATARLGPFAVFLVMLGVATLWLGYLLQWRLLRWPVALVANVAVFIASARAATPESVESVSLAVEAQVLLLVAYLGSFAARTLLLNRDVIPFEVAQSVAASVAGLGGAAYLMHQAGVGGFALGAGTLALALGCYVAAAVFVERLESRRRNYYFYTTAGLVFALAGTAFAVPAGTVGLVYGVFGVAASWAGRFSRRVTYRAHGATYLVAAAAATGMVPHALYGLGVPIVPDGGVTTHMLIVLGLTIVALWGLSPGTTAPRPERRIPRLIGLVLLLGGTLAALVGWLVTSSPSMAAGSLATLRTALLVAGILVLAFASRRSALPEGAWLVYPLLVLAGFKFLVEDLPAGEPATLFVSFALYGLGLVVGPRLARR
jgi:hypothetical protein